MTAIREDPGISTEALRAAVLHHYQIPIDSVTFLPLGHDFGATVYRLGAEDGRSFFLKLRFGPIFAPALIVPRALIDLGVDHILAPLRTQSGELWCSLEGYPGYTLVLSPFIDGQSAVADGLTDSQWRAFGATLNAVHSSGLGDRFRDRIRVETFALPSAELVRQMQALPEADYVDSPAAKRFAVSWRDHDQHVDVLLRRAQDLGARLQEKTFDFVLCHSDIHAANILVGRDGQFFLVDWDGPIIAPRERDLLFIIGARIARTVLPREERLFFEGYGHVDVDLDALVYYRYERIVEDLGEMAKTVLLDPRLSEVAREAEADLCLSFFVPGGQIDVAENVARAG